MQNQEGSPCASLYTIYTTIYHIIYPIAIQDLSLVKCNLRSSLHALCILVKSAIAIVRLLLHRSTELHQLLRHGLVGCFEHVDQCTSQTFLLVGEECDGTTVLACSAGTATVVSMSSTRVDERVTYRPMRCT